MTWLQYFFYSSFHHNSTNILAFRTLSSNMPESLSRSPFTLAQYLRVRWAMDERPQHRLTLQLVARKFVKYTDEKFNSIGLRKWPFMQQISKEKNFWKHRLTQRLDTQHNDTQHKDTQHDGTQHKDTQYNENQHRIIPSVIILSVIDDNCLKKPITASVAIKLIMLNVVMQRVNVQSVAAPLTDVSTSFPSVKFWWGIFATKKTLFFIFFFQHNASKTKRRGFLQKKKFLKISCDRNKGGVHNWEWDLNIFKLISCSLPHPFHYFGRNFYFRSKILKNTLPGLGHFIMPSFCRVELFRV